MYSYAQRKKMTRMNHLKPDNARSNEHQAYATSTYTTHTNTTPHISVKHLELTSSISPFSNSDQAVGCLLSSSSFMDILQKNRDRQMRM
jgi:hypothetical protein